MAITVPSWAPVAPGSSDRVARRVPRSRSLPSFSPPLAPSARRTLPRHRSALGIHGNPVRPSFRESGATVRVSRAQSPSPAPTVRLQALRSSQAPRRSYRPTHSARFTRQQRYGVITALAVLIAMVALVGAGISAEASRVVTEGPARSLVTVGEGDSLWLVATRSMPDADPRAAVRELRELNRLKGTALTPGQQLVIPAQ